MGEPRLWFKNPWLAGNYRSIRSDDGSHQKLRAELN